MSNQSRNSKESVTRRKFILGLAGLGISAATSSALIAANGGVLNSDVLDRVSEGRLRPELSPGTTLGIDNPPFDYVLDPVDFADRILVIVELRGGNDAPSMLVPYTQGAYYDQRPNMSIDASTVIPIDDTLGLSPELQALSQRNYAVVEGVGNTLDSFSHFRQQDEWHGAGNPRAGYVAQLGEELIEKYGSEGIVTLSVNGFSPQLVGASAATLSMQSPRLLETFTSREPVSYTHLTLPTTPYV